MIPRFLANENIPLASVRHLRGAGFDVLAIAETMAGASDREVLRIACEERRWLLTYERDYGELIFRRGLPSPTAVLYWRTAPRTPLEAAVNVEEMLARAIPCDGYFLIIERERIRRRPLPARD